MNPEHNGHQQSGPSRSQGNQGQTGGRPNPGGEARNSGQNRPNQSVENRPPADQDRGKTGGELGRQDEMNREKQSDWQSDANDDG